MEEADSDADRWVGAFPRRLEVDVRLALQAMPQEHDIKPSGSSLTSGTTDSDRHPRGLRVANEMIAIPSRQYLNPISPESTGRVSETSRTIIGCIYSRHHDGFVRQQWSREFVTTTHRWAVPFALQLVGEYVVEIVEQIRDQLARANSDVLDTYESFVAENAEYMGLVRDRAVSYWDCYYRSRFKSWNDYPAAEILTQLRT